MSDRVTCLNCGWVHFGVSRDYIQKWNEDWAELCRTKPEEWLASYGIQNREPPTDKRYYKCFLCGESYKNFRPTQEGDCPDGCTIQPILVE